MHTSSTRPSLHLLGICQNIHFWMCKKYNNIHISDTQQRQCKARLVKQQAPGQ